MRFAEEGQLGSLNETIDNDGAGQFWQLDLLGNLAGSSEGNSFVEYAADAVPGLQAEDYSYREHHVTNAVNEIQTRFFDQDGEGSGLAVAEGLAFENAGNLTANDAGTQGDNTDDVEYFYDAFNRLTKVVNHDAGVDDVNYAYDALGRRAYREAGGDQEWYFYDGNRIIAKVPADGDPQEYVYGLDYIDEPVAVYDDSKSVTKYFVFQDANYNVVAVTDESGNLLQQYRYEPYGLRSGIDDGNGDPIDESLALIPQGFQGLWWDPVTGLYHMRNRDMSPELQRALQRDPNQTALHQHPLERLDRRVARLELMLAGLAGIIARHALRLSQVNRYNLHRWVSFPYWGDPCDQPVDTWAKSPHRVKETRLS